jgi:nucleoside-diphosphate-sugar epimerase
MRFDLAINGMTLGFYKNGKIPIMKDGTQWRPFVHVKDTSLAFALAIESEPEQVSGQILNVGSNEGNYQIYPLAQMVAESIGLPFNFEWYGDNDSRSYRVNFDKIKRVLKFAPKYTAREGAKEIYDALKSGQVTDGPTTNTVGWYRHLMDIDPQLKKEGLGN